MARVTVEDCLVKVPNRFELILLASRRAEQLAKGGLQSLVAEENDKVTVLALREIAEGLIDMSLLDEPKKDRDAILAEAAANFVTGANPSRSEDLAEIESATTQVQVDANENTDTEVSEETETSE